MKTYKHISAVLLAAFVVLYTSSCLKDQLPEATPVVTTPTSYASFDFHTVSEYLVEISLLNSQNQPVDGVLVELYNKRPLASNGMLIADVELNRVFRSVSGSDGKISTRISSASYNDSLFVLVKHIGFPNVTAVPLNSELISVTIGGSNQQAVYAMSKLKSTSEFSPQIVNGFHVLGAWNSLGVPNYLEAVNDVITNDFLADVNASLPEYVSLPQSHPQYLASTNDGTITVKSPCEIWVTFVHEGAGWTNALGYYTYPSNRIPVNKDEITNKTIIFPNVSYYNSGGGLKTGNKVKLYYLNPETNQYSSVFPSGVTVGWCLIAQSWKNGTVTSGVYTHYSNIQQNSESNADLRKHVVQLFDKNRSLLLLGFEDVRRDQGSDQDFNDAIFYATVNPITAIDNTVYQLIDSPRDDDNDGVTNTFDEYPNDPIKAFNNYYPAKGVCGSLAYEDLWPSKGDYDFNDLVIDYNFNQITNAKNNVVQIDSKLSTRAIGASYHNAFGIEYATSPSNVSSVVGQKNTKNYLSITSNGTEAGQSRATVIYFDDAYNVLPYPGSGLCVNTYPENSYATPDTLRSSVVFKTPVSTATLGTPPYNPFIIINKKRAYEVHLPNHTPTSLADKALLSTADDKSQGSEYYITKTDLPWAINIPTRFAYPIEKKDIRSAFNHFDEWAQSQGGVYKDWYLDKVGYRNNSNVYPK